jgi:hypothetical protein
MDRSVQTVAKTGIWVISAVGCDLNADLLLAVRLNQMDGSFRSTEALFLAGYVRMDASI